MWLDIQIKTLHISSAMEANVDITPQEVRLSELPPRKCAIVRRIETEGEDIQRLKMLGVCVGRRIEVVKNGDPLIIRVFGSRLGVSASLAARVWLEVCTTSHCAMRKQALK
jgi:Fe2+ transport system protein FeoA